MAGRKKIERVEVVDKRGNIARPLSADVDTWLSAGWSLVDGAEAQPDDDQDAQNVMTKDIPND